MDFLVNQNQYNVKLYEKKKKIILKKRFALFSFYGISFAAACLSSRTLFALGSSLDFILANLFFRLSIALVSCPFFDIHF